MIIDSIKTKMTENQKELTENLAGKKTNANLSAKKEAQKTLGNAKAILVAENEPKDKSLGERINDAKDPLHIVTQTGIWAAQEAGKAAGAATAKAQQAATAAGNYVGEHEQGSKAENKTAPPFEGSKI